MKALSFGLVQITSNGEQILRAINLGWTRAVAERKLQIALNENLGDIRLAKIELDYLGMGKMENFNIVKVY